MSTLLIASLEPREGRTTVAAGLGALLADGGRSVRLLRLRAAAGADAPAEDDARALAVVPGCDAPQGAVTEQDALAQAKDGVSIVEAAAGMPGDLVSRLSARVVLVSARADEARQADLASAASALGAAFLGAVVTRQQPRRLLPVRAALESRGVRCLAVLPEDRQLAGPTVREMAEALHASRLVDRGDEDEAVEYVMLGPISADPGQPYFLDHAHKAVINRFDKMDLHLAALATDPACLILTGGRPPSPYLIDRVQGSEADVTVLSVPDNTVRTIEVLDDMLGRTRFSGRRKVDRAAALMREHADKDALIQATN
ncbi:MAG: DRTGG domain-containing protein [Dehalococcoidia bacterium]